MLTYFAQLNLLANEMLTKYALLVEMHTVNKYFLPVCLPHMNFHQLIISASPLSFSLQTIMTLLYNNGFKT